MKTYKFEIQNCIEVEVVADSKEDARQWLVNNKQNYADDMVDNSCWISNGEENE
jgi:hypothetical protein